MRPTIVAAAVVAAWPASAYAHVTVHWTDVPARGSTAEPEHPAPTLQLAAANPTTTAHSGSSQTGSVVLASMALAVAVVALGVAVLRRRTT